MATPDHRSVRRPSTEASVARAVTAIMGTVVGLTFLFGFGNVLNLALRLGVPGWVALLVAPAVDLSILGLLLGTRHLALAGASADVLRPARRLLLFASVVTLALNVADPIVAGEYGKAAFDAVGPLLLIGWAEVGPTFLQAIGATGLAQGGQALIERDQAGEQTPGIVDSGSARSQVEKEQPGVREHDQQTSPGRSLEVLLDQARREDAAHRTAHQKPISADTLRVRLAIGATRARRLVKIIRNEFHAEVGRDLVGGHTAPAGQSAAAVIAAA